jgi:RNA polymerase sigma-70 factor (ECF subfamily)
VPVFTWIYRITINLCIDHTRQQIRYRKRGIDTSKSADDLLAKVEDFNFSPPTKSIETEELLAHFRTVMLQLSSQQRQVFILRHRDGMMLSEIAQKLK